MKVVDHRTEYHKVRFIDLEVGAVYEDATGSLCIKTSEGGGYGNCITLVPVCDREGWETSEESISPSNLVRPIEATLVLDDME